MGSVFSAFNCPCFIIYNLSFGTSSFEAPRTRVKLSTSPDYINANWIRVRDSDIKYRSNSEIFNRLNINQSIVCRLLLLEQEKCFKGV